MIQHSVLTSGVRDLVYSWFAALDRRDAIEEIVPLFARTGLEMQFPEGKNSGIDGLRTWYEQVTNIFFDQKHEIRDIRVTPTGSSTATVDVVVHWYASTWDPPAPKSKSIASEAMQQWTVIPGDEGKLVIQEYRVLSLAPLPE